MDSKQHAKDTIAENEQQFSQAAWDAYRLEREVNRLRWAIAAGDVDYTPPCMEKERGRGRESDGESKGLFK